MIYTSSKRPMAVNRGFAHIVFVGGVVGLRVVVGPMVTPGPPDDLGKQKHVF